MPRPINRRPSSRAERFQRDREIRNVIDIPDRTGQIDNSASSYEEYEERQNNYRLDAQEIEKAQREKEESLYNYDLSDQDVEHGGFFSKNFKAGRHSNNAILNTAIGAGNTLFQTSQMLFHKLHEGRFDDAMKKLGQTNNELSAIEDVKDYARQLQWRNDLRGRQANILNQINDILRKNTLSDPNDMFSQYYRQNIQKDPSTHKSYDELTDQEKDRLNKLMGELNAINQNLEVNDLQLDGMGKRLQDQKHTNTVSDLLYDINKYHDWKSKEGFLKGAVQSAGQLLLGNNADDIVTNYAYKRGGMGFNMTSDNFNALMNSESVSDAIVNTINTIGSPIIDALYSTGSLIEGIFHGAGSAIQSTDYNFREAIRNLKPGDTRADLFFKDSKKYTYDPQDVNELISKLDNYQKFYEDERLEREQDVLSRQNTLKNGHFLFNPNKLDPDFKYDFENEDHGVVEFFKNPIKNIFFAIPEMGSSFSDFESFLGQVAVSGAAAQAATIGQLVAFGPESGGKVLNSKWITNKLFGKAGAIPKIEKEIQDLSLKNQQIQNTISRTKSNAKLKNLKSQRTQNEQRIKELLNDRDKVFKTVEGFNEFTQTGAIGGTLWLSHHMRDQESSIETVNAYAQKVMQYIHDNKLNMNRILDYADEQLREYGVDTDKYDDLQKLKLALSYNVDLGDAQLNEYKTKAQKGLAKVYNDNMTLSTLDWAENLAFMPYVRKAIAAQVSHFPKPRIKPKWDKQTYANIEKANNKYLYSTPEFQEALKKSSIAFVNNKITKAISKSKVLNAIPINGMVMASRPFQYIANKAKKFAPGMFGEGVEEGIQELLTNKYIRGEFDSERYVETSFNTESLLNNAYLAATAVADYLGINPGDPDNGSQELRRAMDIGAVTRLFFGGYFGGSNLTHTKQNNLRNMITQMKTDYHMKDYVAQNLNAKEDDSHVGLFYDLFQKRGVTSQRVVNSLNEMKKYKGDYVTDDYIDKDIQLARTAYRVINNKELDPLFESAGIEKGSENHKQIVKNAVRDIVDMDTLSNAEANVQQKLGEVIGNIRKETSKYGDKASLYNTILNILKKQKKSGIDVNIISKEREEYINETSDNSILEKHQDEIYKVYHDKGSFAADDERNRIIKEERVRRGDAYDAEMVKFDKYAERVIGTFFHHLLLKNQDAVVKNVSRIGLYNAINRELGTDIDTDRMSSLVSRMKKGAKSYKYAQSAFDEDFTKYMEDIFKAVGEEDVNELNQLAQASLLHTAAMEALAPYVELYTEGEVSNPKSISPRSFIQKWTDLSKEEKDAFKNRIIEKRKQEGKSTELTDVQFQRLYNIDQINQRNNYYQALYDIQQKYSEIENAAKNAPIDKLDSEIGQDLKSLRKSTAKFLLFDDLKDRRERKRIAHKEWLEDEDANLSDISDVELRMEAQQEQINNQIREETKQMRSRSFSKDEKNRRQNEIDRLKELDQQRKGTLVERESKQRSQRDYRTIDQMRENQKIQISNYVVFNGKFVAITLSPENVEEINKFLSEHSADNFSRLQDGDIIASIFEKDHKIAIRYVKDVQTIEGLVYTVHRIETVILEKGKTKLIDIVPVGNDERLYFVPNYQTERGESVQAQGLAILDQDDRIGLYKHRYTGEDVDSEQPTAYDEFVYKGGSVVEVKQGTKPKEEKKEEKENKKEKGKSTKSTKTPVVTEEKSELPEYEEENENGPVQLEIPFEIVDNDGISDNEDASMNTEDADEFQKALDETVTKKLLDEQIYIDQDDVASTQSLWDFYGDENEDTASKDKVDSEYLAKTFYYDPEATDPFELKINGVSIKLPYGVKQLQPGKELAKKLSETGWFSNCKKYYVVTGNEMRLDKDVSEEDFMDSLSVVMLIVDDSNKDDVKIYATALRSLSGANTTMKSNSGRIVDKNFLNYQKLINSLEKIGVRDEYGRRLGSKQNWREVLTKEELDDINSSKSKQERDLALERYRIKHGGRLTQRQIGAEINKLRKFRNAIISAYLDRVDGKLVLPNPEDEIKTHVRPDNARISSGTISSDGNYQKLSDRAKLIPNTIKGIIEARRNGTLRLGFGTGMLPKAAFKIKDVFNAMLAPYKGIGYGGKMFYIFKRSNGQKNIDVPIMLREVKLNTQYDLGGDATVLNSADDVVLTIDKTTGSINTTKSKKTSVAELVFYLITGQFDTSQFTKIVPRMSPTNQALAAQQLLDFIVRNGDETSNYEPEFLGKYGNELRKKFFYTAIDEHGQRILNIGDKSYIIDDIMNNVDENQLKEVIFEIANNLHWNTSIKKENSDITLPLPSFIINAAKKYFTDNPSAKEFSMFGVPELTFAKDDLFEEKNGKLKEIDNLITVDWMLSSGKLLTDLTETPFYAPFVYADGIQIEPSVEIIHQEKKESEEEAKKKKSQKKGKSSQSNQEEQKTIFTEGFVSLMHKVLPRLKSIFKKDSEYNIQQERDELASSLEDVFILDIDLSENINVDEKIFNIKEKLQNALDSFNKRTNQNLTLNDVNEISKDEIENTTTGIVVIHILKTTDELTNKRVNFQIMTPRQFDRVFRKGSNIKGITGVYSTVRGEGVMNPEKSRAFLMKKLGIQDEQIFIANGILTAISGKTAYGLFNVAIEGVNQEISPIFQLSKLAGYGIEYHEGFHYVNLLLHSPEERIDFYNRFIKINPQYSKMSYADVEEALAEDFRRYAILRDDRSVKGTIKRWFNNILAFINFTNTNKRKIRNLYRDIYNGKYAKLTPNIDAFAEFKKTYPTSQVLNKVENAQNVDEYSSFYVPGQDYSELGKLKYINNPDIYYKVCEALSFLLIQKYKPNTVGKLTNLAQDKKITQELKDLALAQANNTELRDIINEVSENLNFFKSVIIDTFKQYGLVPKFREKEAEELEEKDKSPEKGDRFDIDHFEQSRKDNVAFRAKLFLTIIPVKQKVFNEETGEFEFQYVSDDIFGTDTYYSFGEAWRQILTNLWNSQSFEDIYEKVKLLSTSSGFFNSLLDSFEEVRNSDDIQLKNQIESTIRCAKSQVTFFTLQDPYRSDQEDDDVNLTYNEISDDSDYYDKVWDTSKKWILTSGNALSGEKQLTRNWSKQAMANGMIVQNKNKLKINKEYVSILRHNLYGQHGVQNKIRKLVGGKSEITSESYNEVLEALSDVLSNNMSIPSSAQLLDNFLNFILGIQSIENINEEQLYVEKLKRLQDFIDSESSGSIKNIVQMLIGASQSGRSEFIINNKITKQFNQVYYGYRQDSFISQYAKFYERTFPSDIEFSIRVPGKKNIYPINTPNFLSDRLSKLKQDDEFLSTFIENSYCRNSKLLNYISENKRNKKNTGDWCLFRGMQDGDYGASYMELSSVENYIMKWNLTLDKASHNNQLQSMIVSPTMADKPSYFTLPIDRSVYSHLNDDTYSILSDGKIQFGENAIATMRGYILDEIDAMLDYYDKDMIKAIITDKNNRYDNYHGKVKNGKMLFGGNGGIFRYFGTLMTQTIEDVSMNLNEYLSYLYQKEQKDLANPNIQPSSISVDEADGFEYIRDYLKELRDNVQNRDVDGSINDYINNLVEKELEQISNKSKLGIIEKDEYGYKNKFIPWQIINHYEERLKNIIKDRSDIIRIAVGEFVLSQFISIEEFEKVFVGDPAFFKYKTSHREVKIDGATYKLVTSTEKHSDKIKRLGGLLSPGSIIALDYSNKQLEKYPELRKTKFTTLTINDLKSTSDFIGKMNDIFDKQNVYNYLYSHPESAENLLTSIKEQMNISVNDIYDLVNKINSGEINFEDIYKLLDDDVIQNTSSLSSQQTGLYNDNNINVTDGSMFIRGDLFRRILIGLGEWQLKTDEAGYSDEIAYRLLEGLDGDEKWYEDPEKLKIVNKFMAKALKMTYYQNDPAFVQLQNGIQKQLNTEVYYKMALFPVFKFTATNDVWGKLYNRMNRPGSEIDAIVCNSAIKVGNPQERMSILNKEKDGYSILDILESESDMYINENGDVCVRNGEKLLNVGVKDLSNLRLQLNTDAHLKNDRFVGTQVAKLMFSSLFPDLDYSSFLGTAKGKHIANNIINTVTKLSDLGYEELIKIFDTSTNKKRESLRRYLVEIMKNNGFSRNEIAVFLNETAAGKNRIESLDSRDVFEQSVCKKIFEKVIKIVTPGGTAIQQSSFGFTGFGNKNVRDDSSDYFKNYNGGKKLKWMKEDGSQEVLLSIKFFDAILPKEIRNDYQKSRQWLIDRDIIKGTKSDGTESKPTPYGVGYRIPTQGLSSTFAMTVADVLPRQVGDLIVVPEEFTAQTGSDFDIDKLYLAFKSFDKDGKEISSPEIDDNVDFDNLSKTKLTNFLIKNYIHVLCSNQNVMLTRSSIDTVISKIKSVVNSVRSGKVKDYFGGYELLPSFQNETKSEFKIGKDGIGALALQLVNIALTQWSHITLPVGNYDYKQLPLDSILSADGSYVQDWFSGILTAHVDVAKDAYIKDLNMNPLTYDMIAYLLRSGFGRSAITFLAQPSITQYIDAVGNTVGKYGLNTGVVDNDNALTKKKRYALQETILNLGTELTNLNFTSKWKDQLRENYVKFFTAYNSFVQSNKSNKEYQKFLNAEIYNIVFNEELSEWCLQNPETDDAKLISTLSLMVFNQLQPNAEKLSSLVQTSQIDTEKMGNTLLQLLFFQTKYNLIKYNGGFEYSDDKYDQGIDPLWHYFEDSFLEPKLHHAHELLKLAMGGQIFTALPVFEQIFSGVMVSLKGRSTYTNRDGLEEITFSPYVSMDVVDQVGNIVRNIMRQMAVIMYGSMFDFTKIKNEQIKPAMFAGLDQTFEDKFNFYQNLVKRLLIGDDNTKPLTARLGEIKLKLKTDDEFALSSGVVDSVTGKIINEFLNMLIPMTNNTGYDIITLSDYNFTKDEYKKSRYASEWSNLLNSENEEIREFAKDLVLYAYITSFSGGDSVRLFSLVPPYFRQQLDFSITMALKNGMFGDMLREMALEYGYSYTGQDGQVYGNISEFIYDIICRNYYDKDLFVPTINLDNTSNNNRRDFFNPKKQYSGGILMIPTSKDKYVKVYNRFSKRYDLYQRVGVVEKTTNLDKPDSEQKQYRSGVYKKVGKLGIPILFEIVSPTKSSIFDINKLAESLQNLEDISNIRAFVEQELKNIVEKNVRLEFEEDPHSDIIIRSQYYKEKQSKSTPVISNENNSVAFVVTNNIDSYIGEERHVSINIGETIKLSDSIEKSAKTIANIIGETDDKITIFFSSSDMVRRMVEVSEEEIEKQVQLIKEQNAELESPVELSEEKLIAYAKANAKDIKIGNFIQQLLTEVSNIHNIKLSRIIVNGADNQLTKIINQLLEKSDLFHKILPDRSTVLLTSTMSKDQIYKKFGSTVSKLYFDSEEFKQEKERVEQVIKESEEKQVELEQKKINQVEEIVNDTEEIDNEEDDDFITSAGANLFSSILNDSAKNKPKQDKFNHEYC